MNRDRRVGRLAPMLSPGLYLGVHLAELGPALVVDVREYRGSPLMADPERVSPTPRYIAFDITRLPMIRALLEQAEAEAIAAGRLTAEDYENAALPVPPSLRGAA